MERLRALCEKKGAIPGDHGLGGLHRFVRRQADRRPIVQTRPLEVAIFEDVAEWLHEVQPRSRAGTQTRNTAGVLRNLRVHQHDVLKTSVQVADFEARRGFDNLSLRHGAHHYVERVGILRGGRVS